MAINYLVSWHDDDEGHWTVTYHINSSSAEKEFERQKKVAWQKDSFDVNIDSLTISKVVR
jgi:hypothetical protein|tara:strand:+ start:14559 stop:14738 length:180 start_codon:yes stop_codon:yes gene_type:complete